MVARVLHHAASVLRVGTLFDVHVWILLTLLASMVLAWPAADGVQAPFMTVAAVRALLLTWVAVDAGLRVGRLRAELAGYTLALLVIALTTLPFEAWAWAVSGTVVPLWWLLARPLWMVPTLVLVGALFAQRQPPAWLAVLLPFIVLGVTLGIDGLGGLTMFNPITTAWQPSAAHVLAYLLLGLGCGVAVWRAGLRARA